ncbi:MAG: RNA-guided pseudouridylation complex pseudouridine synthase subunit Cbf5 [Candidatus Thalassarchaeaceae archaeon]|nr:RNA-guided pseudouridylation complex pseudouridine synthase subunit Cbf5 [Candidatus Thalassarchaeaceae archaeon]
MAIQDYWILDKNAETNEKYGCRPNDRSITELLDSGIILINKSSGPTSHQLTAWARNLLGLNRLGHGGTLDPFATGLLTLLCGKATKITNIVLNSNKSYVAVIRFENPVAKDDLKELLISLNGDIYNVPPKESAVKVQVRSRSIYSMNLLDLDDSGKVAIINLSCNAGTYVRTLTKDIGLLLGNNCDLIELHRDMTGNFDESMACTMHQLTDAVFLWQNQGDDRGLKRLMSPIEIILNKLPKIYVKDGAVSAVSHGAPLAKPGIVRAAKGIKKGDSVIILSLKEEAVAIATLNVNSEDLVNMSSGQVATAQSVLMVPGTYPQTWATK